MFKIENTYSDLDKRLFSKVLPEKIKDPKIILLNEKLIKDYRLPFKNDIFTLNALSWNDILNESISLAQAYAWHQFWYLNILWDWRAILLWEFIKNNTRYDLQLKWSWITPYSRSWDWKATLYSMFREYIISEAMYNLKIPTSRSLWVVWTWELLYRENLEQWAILSRISKSHIRIWTFEYVSLLNDKKVLKDFTDYTIKRHYPTIFWKNDMYTFFLDKVAKKQIDLVVNWLRVWFIHWVMNTDNTTISWETIDYGPCAFLNSYNKNKVFSYIDTNWRYSFLNQKHIIFFNLSKLVNSIIPILWDDLENIVKNMNLKIDKWQNYMEKKYYLMMWKKIWIKDIKKDNYFLVDDLLNIMESKSLDYTNTFISLYKFLKTKDLGIFTDKDLIDWVKKWENVIKIYDKNQLLDTMKKTNPFIIPRNHLVEISLENAVNWDLTHLNNLLEKMRKPYDYKNIDDFFTKPPLTEYWYKTYCWT